MFPRRTRSTKNSNSRRSGAIAVLFAFMLVPLLAMVAFVVDYSFLVSKRVDLQRSTDQAVLAAVRDLVPNSAGQQDIAKVKATLRTYVTRNLGLNYVVLDDDIVIGRYDPNSIYGNIIIRNDGVFDTVKLTLRQDDSANSSISLFFARVMGLDESDVRASAIAVLQKASLLTAGTDVFPVAVPKTAFNAMADGQVWSIYGDGKVADPNGNEMSGNWGTIDIGDDSNSTTDLVTQIQSGLSQSDINSLVQQGAIPSSEGIPGTVPTWLDGNTGLSTGMKSAVESVHGMTKLMPIVDTNNGDTGDNLKYHVVGWAAFKIVDSRWNGAKNTRIFVTKSYMYDSDLRPQSNLANTTSVISNAYSNPVLVQ